MIRPIANEKKLSLDNGDIDIYGLAHNILPATALQADDHYLPLDYISLSPWDAVWKAGIDMITAIKATQDTCPITGLLWHGFIPIGLVVKDVTPYLTEVPAHVRQMAADKGWNENYFPDIEQPPAEELGAIARTMLGTGFSFGIMPYDGSGELKWFEIKLDNGDRLIGAGHVWYNK